MKDKLEKFIYSPEYLTWGEYWEIARAESLSGRYIPCYFYDRSARFASKLIPYSSVVNWEKIYETRIFRMTFLYHRRKFLEWSQKS
jgi:hypothetical protein